MKPHFVYIATGDSIARVNVGSTGSDTAISLEGSGAECVAVDPTNPYRVLAGTLDSGLYRSNDGGETWIEANTGIEHPRVMSVAFAPAHSESGKLVAYAGTEPSRLYRSTDDAESWELLPALHQVPSSERWFFPPRPWTHHVRWIAPSHFDPDLIFVGIELGGVMTSRDGGVTWEDHHPDACVDPHVLRTHPSDPNRAYEVAGDGVAFSIDEGRTWVQDLDGMDRSYCWGLAVDPEDPDLWYISAAPGPQQAHSRSGRASARLYRRSDSWEAIEIAGLGGVKSPMPRMPYSLVTLPVAPKALVALIDDGSLFLSEDSGESWIELEPKLGNVMGAASAAL